MGTTLDLIYKHLKPYTFGWLMVVLLFSSCSQTKYLAENEILYSKDKINLSSNEVEKFDLKRYQRISPNKRIFGLRIHLFLYNIAKKDKENWMNNWLRKIGEEPIIYDSVLVYKTIENYERFLSNMGYVNNTVEKTTKINKNKAKVVYNIELGEPILIRKFNYVFEDTSIQRFVYADTINSVIKSGMNFNKTLLKEERERIATHLKTKGFYSFSKEYIYYEWVYAQHVGMVDLDLVIKQSITGRINPKTKIKQHMQYQINYVTINSSGADPDETDMVTENLEHLSIHYKGGKDVRPQVLNDANLIDNGTLYSSTRVKKTYSNYSKLGLFKYINIDFTEVPSNNEYGLVDCEIDLAMREKAGISTELVGTNSGLDFGGQANLSYKNHNLFRGAEKFQLTLSGAIEGASQRYNQEGLEAIKEFGIDTKLDIPKFLLPLKLEGFVEKYNPNTTINFSYHYQDQPDFIRTMARTSFGYKWKGNELTKHTIYPFEFNLVKLPEGYINKEYYNSYLRGTSLESSYKDHAVISLRYGFEYSNQKVSRNRDYFFFRYGTETAGLLFNSIAKAIGDSLLFGVPYFQYLKNDFDFRYFNVISPKNSFVYRLNLGIGLPYGNSVIMPLEKMYYAGGASGLRAWQANFVGPGTYLNTVEVSNERLIINPGDIKIEANAEYRFKLIWKLEGAVFLDVGNVWLLNKNSNYSGGQFHWNSFLDQMAVGTGFGTRFDFSFVMLRLDFGYKLRDPSIPGNVKWINRVEDYPNKRWVAKFGIGYPF